MRIDGLAHGLFALALASVAILSLSYGNFVPMGQSLSRLDSGAAGSGSTDPQHAAAGLPAPVFASRARPWRCGLTVTVYQALWAVVCAVPIFSKPLLGAWYGLS